jgi:hypothetical protein
MNPSKQCGNCARVSFGLNREETELLKIMVQHYGIQCVLRWLKAGSVRLAGGSGRLDLEKMAALSIIRKHQTYCNTANSRVLWIEESCFQWLPAPEAEPIGSGPEPIPS